MEQTPEPSPQNSILVKADTLDAQQVAEFKQQDVNVTFVDLEVFQAQEKATLATRQQAHEHRLEESRLRAELAGQALAERHRRGMQLLSWTGEFALKVTVFSGGFYFACHGERYTGTLLMGAVASTFSKGFIKSVWKNDA